MIRNRFEELGHGRGNRAEGSTVRRRHLQREKEVEREREVGVTELPCWPSGCLVRPSLCSFGLAERNYTGSSHRVSSRNIAVGLEAVSIMGRIQNVNPFLKRHKRRRRAGADADAESRKVFVLQLGRT